MNEFVKIHHTGHTFYIRKEYSTELGRNKFFGHKLLSMSDFAIRNNTLIKSRAWRPPSPIYDMIKLLYTGSGIDIIEGGIDECTRYYEMNGNFIAETNSVGDTLKSDVLQLEYLLDNFLGINYDGSLFNINSLRIRISEEWNVE